MVDGVSIVTDLDNIAKLCQRSPIGKHLPKALYVHIQAVSALNPQLRYLEKQARRGTTGYQNATLVKFHTDQPKISYLFYPDFDDDPHPALHRSIQVDLITGEVGNRDYTQTENPPILHRKETFVTPDYPNYDQFTHLTRQEEALGLLDNSRFIGTQLDWEWRLRDRGLQVINHTLACPLNAPNKKNVQIDRHKAALVRNDLSRPVKIALEAGVLSGEMTFFDYGCGYGGDVERLRKQGFTSSGWDPYYRPDNPHLRADVVNLGYIINVIEDPKERREALVNAWDLTQQVLIVSAQVLINDRSRQQIAFGDGIITRRNTFQKYYEQEELKAYIDQILGVDAIPVGIGIYLVFRDETQAENFRASRFRSRATTPRISKPIQRFEDYEELLKPLMDFVTQRGRLPKTGELETESEIKAQFRSYKQAFKLILQVTEAEEWDTIADQRADELKLYLALSHFTRRPKSIKAFSPAVRHDLKTFFGSYKQACLLADLMLLSLRDQESIADICNESPIGKKLRNSFLIHISALDHLDPILRLYEGCASRTIGRTENVTVVKFHTRKPKISYLHYPDFDTNPHPILHSSMHIDLRDLNVSYWDYDTDPNPPILHHKEQLVTPDYPLYDKFAKLTHQEEDWGLLDDLASIQRLQGWRHCLEDHCATFNNYRLLRRKDADPYKLKLLKAAVDTRRRNRRKN
jgi:DNA phosphorothioation-associated putative methyltransferase